LQRCQGIWWGARVSAGLGQVGLVGCRLGLVLGLAGWETSPLFYFKTVSFFYCFTCLFKNHLKIGFRPEK
jgi:hypothetical protein